jgi:hypothetical protein
VLVVLLVPKEKKKSNKIALKKPLNSDWGRRVSFVKKIEFLEIKSTVFYINNIL